MTRKTKVLLGRFLCSLNIFNLPKTLRSFGEFDEVTKFRLINSFIMTLGAAILVPIITVLKGTLMLIWVIALFGILETLSVKLNELIVHSFSIDKVYKMTVVTHIFYTLVPCIYFINPVVMIYLGSIILVIEIAILSAYNIMLNNYIAKKYPKSMSRFQIVKNSAWADSALITLFFTTVALYFFPKGFIVVVFIIINSIFSIWLLKNWNFYKGIDY